VGQNDAAREAAAEYVEILEEKGDRETIDQVRQEFLSRDLPFGGAGAATARKPAASLAAEPAISIEDVAGSGEISFDLDSGPTELEFDLEEPAPAPTPPPVARPAAKAPPKTVERPIEIIEEIEEFEEIEEIGEAEPELVMETAQEYVPEPVFELPPEPVLELEPESSFAIEEPPVIEPEPVLQEPIVEESPLVVDTGDDAEPFFGVEALGSLEPSEPSLEEIGEVDFYIEQELFEEARGKLDLLIPRFPDNLDLESRRERIEASIAAAEASAAVAAAAAAAAAASIRPPTLSRDEIESELLSAIPDDDEEEFAPPPPPPPPAAPAPPPPIVSASLAQEENLFADEDNFFDLAAELESELAEDEAISLSEEEQSLEEIFKEFKKGVEQQLDSEDYDTHYNLGIAYKEMGLIDEAIGEFQLASKDPKRAVECASMLGLCFLEKGMPQLAIKWYRKGLEMPEISEEEHIGLLYDLGSAYQEVGDTDNAQKAFMEVYGLNLNYRDIVGRIKQLEDSRK
jgi:tetratricopeptide (TPR) repeat protein